MMPTDWGKTGPTKRIDQIERLTAALADRYAIERELGSGGMASVYLANDVRHRRKVAVKVLQPNIAEAIGSDRFMREIEIAARMNHPHILALYDSGEAAGYLFYVMPYIRGESLRQRLLREHQLPINEAIDIVRQIALALEHAHSHGLIHRDVKPENILIHEGEAMIADFGIAVAMTSSGVDRLTGTGTFIGTPQYMSPEQFTSDRDLDARSDIYSLGCVLYELLAGEPPHIGAAPQAVIAKRLTHPVPAVRLLRPTVPSAVEEALLKALARVPADRYASAAEFAAALTAPGGFHSRMPSVAVLPFLNLSADPENEFFADGITEDVIAQLSKMRSLKVISRTSVMPFKKREQNLREIGAILQVGTLLEGSVRRSGDRVRIVAQLIDAEADQHLWADTYDRQLTDIFAIQTDVALQIAAALQAELSPHELKRLDREPTSDVRAYQLYLQGRHWHKLFSEKGTERAINYFQQAIAADPSYAMAYVGLAAVYADWGDWQGAGMWKEEEAYQRGMEAVTKALALDSGLAEAHEILALFKCIHDFDWVGAEREFQLALELSPGNARIYNHYGWLCYALGRFEEAIPLVKRAQELDPLTHRTDLATTLIRAGRYQEATESALQAVEFDPEVPRGRATLGWAYVMNGIADQGVAELEVATKLAPDNTLYLGQLGQAYGMTGKEQQAKQVLRQLERLSQERYVSPYHFAYVYTGLGEQDRAMDYLERAYAERAGNMFGIRGSFLFKSLHSHPRFKALLRKMNLG
jgi:serine/threonine-protein kinase